MMHCKPLAIGAFLLAEYLGLSPPCKHSTLPRSTRQESEQCAVPDRPLPYAERSPIESSGIGHLSELQRELRALYAAAGRALLPGAGRVLQPVLCRNSVQATGETTKSVSLFPHHCDEAVARFEEERDFFANIILNNSQLRKCRELFAPDAN